MGVELSLLGKAACVLPRAVGVMVMAAEWHDPKPCASDLADHLLGPQYDRHKKMAAPTTSPGGRAPVAAQISFIASASSVCPLIRSPTL